MSNATVWTLASAQCALSSDPTASIPIFDTHVFWSFVICVETAEEIRRALTSDKSRAMWKKARSFLRAAREASWASIKMSLQQLKTNLIWLTAQSAPLAKPLEGEFNNKVCQSPCQTRPMDGLFWRLVRPPKCGVDPYALAAA
jgi:hypothetical protein